MMRMPPPPWMMPPPAFFAKKMAEFKKNQKEKYEHKPENTEKTTGELVDEVLKEADSDEEKNK
jgi:hypothetical protein